MIGPIRDVWNDASALRSLGAEMRDQQLAFIRMTQNVFSTIARPRPSKPNTAGLFQSAGYARGCAMVRRAVADEYRDNGKPQDYADHCLRLATEYERKAGER